MIQAAAISKPDERRAAPPREPGPLPAPSIEMSHLDDRLAEDLVQAFKLFADETRLKILHYLTQRKEMNVRALCDLLHQSQPAVSHHLALLRVAGFIDSRRDGKHNYYHIAPKRFHELLKILFTSGPGNGSLQVFEDFVLSYEKTRK